MIETLNEWLIAGFDFNLLSIHLSDTKFHIEICKIYRICHELTVEIKFYQTSVEKCY